MDQAQQMKHMNSLGAWTRRGRHTVALWASCWLLAAGLGGCEGGEGDLTEDRADGQTTQPDGQTTQPDGQTTQPDGQTTQPDTLPDADTLPDTNPIPTGPHCFQDDVIEVGFFVLNPGESAEKDVTIHNCSDAPLTFNDANRLGSDDLSIVNADALRGSVIPAGEAITLRVRYAETSDDLSSADFALSTDPSTRATLRVVIWTWPDTCAPDMITTADATFGQPALADGDFLYIAGDPNAGSPWQLAEVSLRDRTLTPVIEVDSAWTWADWIEINGDEVSVLEFYPGGTKHTFNRRTRAVSRADAPYREELTPYPLNGSLFSVHVGQGEGDDCANVCILRDDQAGAAPVELIDDADQDFSLHTGAVYFIDDYVYFMTYQSVFNTPGSPAFRRMNLLTGQLEVAFTFDGPRANAWVYAPVRAADGALFWLRYEQATLDAPWLAYIDRYDPATNQTTAGFISGLGRDARNLSIQRSNVDYFVWTDTDGVFSALAIQGSPPSALATHGAAPSPESSQYTYYTGAEGRVYYVLATASRDARVSRLGCVTLPPI